MPLNESNSYEYWGLGRPLCPHCDMHLDVFGDDWVDGILEEDEREVECPSCSNTFILQTEISYSFSSKLKEEEEGE